MYEILISVSTMILIVAVGTVAYHNIEQWSYTDSFYFSSITVMTIGYGDMHPTTSFSKLFTVFYAIAGVSVGIVTLTIIGSILHRRISEEREKARKHIRNTIDAAVKTHRNITNRGKFRNT
ncbi:two pore domain potassium channel family protein [archaeon]|nr:two pore domain potassium channel family protein [archaeon]